MFYANMVLDKKGPMSKIWLAAHWEKKLNKAHIFEINIDESVDGIIAPKMKMALRTSGHLLLGLVRIYSKKAKFLLVDCNEAFVKIKMAFRPGQAEFQGDNIAAPNSITLPEQFIDIDTTMPILENMETEDWSCGRPDFQKRTEDITLREDYGSGANFRQLDDTFGESGFQGAITASQDHLGEGSLFAPDPLPITSSNESITLPETIQSSLLDDSNMDSGFGNSMGLQTDGSFRGGLFEEPILEGNVHTTPAASIKIEARSQGVLLTPSVDNSLPNLPLILPNISNIPSLPISEREILPLPNLPTDTIPLPQNEGESFPLAPVDVHLPEGIRRRNRRRLMVDDTKNISGDEMKAQMSDTSDIVNLANQDLAPPTKSLMQLKETGGAVKLFLLPGRAINSRIIAHSYSSISQKPTENQDFGLLGDSEVEKSNIMELQTLPEEAKEARKRKRMQRNVGSDGEEDFVHTKTERNIGASERRTRASEKKNPFLGPNTAQDISGFEGILSSTPRQNNGGSRSFPSDTTGSMGWDSLDDVVVPIIDDSISYADDLAETNEVSGSGGIHENGDDVIDDGQRAEGETDEQFEKKRAVHFNTVLKSKFSENDDELNFSSLTISNNRKQVVQKFYSLLVLQKLKAVEMKQESCYGELNIFKGSNFNRKIKC